MTAEKEINLDIDRFEAAMLARHEAFCVLLDVIGGNHPRSSEIMCLLHQYGDRCAEVVEEKMVFLKR